MLGRKIVFEIIAPLSISFHHAKQPEKIHFSYVCKWKTQDWKICRLLFSLFSTFQFFSFLLLFLHGHLVGVITHFIHMLQYGLLPCLSYFSPKLRTPTWLLKLQDILTPLSPSKAHTSPHSLCALYELKHYAVFKADSL